MVTAYIGLGSNQGERLRAISDAIVCLHRSEGLQVTQLSLIREYDPVGGPPQDPYLNSAVEVETSLTARQLLAALQAIEGQLGRQRSNVRWGPRIIDLDLLLYGRDIINDADLIVPHPRLAERHFVLEPLTQLAPDTVHPTMGRTMQQLLEHLCASSVPPPR